MESIKFDRPLSKVSGVRLYRSADSAAAEVLLVPAGSGSEFKLYARVGDKPFAEGYSGAAITLAGPFSFGVPDVSDRMQATSTDNYVTDLTLGGKQRFTLVQDAALPEMYVPLPALIVRRPTIGHSRKAGVLLIAVYAHKPGEEVRDDKLRYFVHHGAIEQKMTATEVTQDIKTISTSGGEPIVMEVCDTSWFPGGGVLVMDILVNRISSFSSPTIWLDVINPETVGLDFRSDGNDVVAGVSVG